MTDMNEKGKVLIAVYVVFVLFLMIQIFKPFTSEAITTDALDMVCEELHGKGSYYHSEFGVQERFTCQKNNTVIIKDPDKIKISINRGG